MPRKKNSLKGDFELAREYNLIAIFNEVKTSVKFYSAKSKYYLYMFDLTKPIDESFYLSVIGGRKEVISIIKLWLTAHE